MKRKTGWALGCVAGALLLVAVLVTGCAGIDRALYNQSVTYTNVVATRFVTNAVVVTNTVVEISEVARPVSLTNALGVVSAGIVREPSTNLVASVVTNYVPVIVQVPERVAVTNLVDREGVLATTAIFSKGVDMALPGFGSLVALALGGAYHVYQQMRNKQVTAALVQGIETAREVLSTTPQGQAADAQLVTWLKDHQREAGVLGAVSQVVEATVDNDAARGAAAVIQARVKAAAGAG